MAEQDDIRAMAQRFFDAIEVGDIETMQGSFTPDAEIWHNTDGIVQSPDDNAKTLSWITANLPEQRRAAYDLGDIRRWMEVFIRRFFASQFKRSALPNGPKVSHGGTMSPRGDWRMPSDASAAAWLAELENVPES